MAARVAWLRAIDDVRASGAGCERVVGERDAGFQPRAKRDRSPSGTENGVVARSVASGKMRGTRSWRGRARRGQATIEFAVMLPLMLLLCLGAIDVGRVFFDYIGIRAAAMEGARYGAYRPTDSAGAEARVREHFSGSGPAGLAVTASPTGNCQTVSTDGSTATSGLFTVTVTTDFIPLTLAALQALAPGTDWDMTVQATASTRCMT